MATGAPRVCGDDPCKTSATVLVYVVLPAYAGMIPVNISSVVWSGGCSPRMRG